MKNRLMEVIKKLSENRIDFVVCGGVACILQGCDRSTYDLDINVALSDDNLKAAVNLFRKMKFYPRIPEPFEALLDVRRRESWVREKNAIVYTVLSDKGEIQIDIFLVYSIDYKELKQNADIFKIEGCDIYVSSKEDLINAKRNVKPLRDKDIYDIKQLEELLKNEQKADWQRF
jgi:hypothetical protein